VVCVCLRDRRSGVLTGNPALAGGVGSFVFSLSAISGNEDELRCDSGPCSPFTDSMDELGIVLVWSGTTVALRPADPDGFRSGTSIRTFGGCFFLDLGLPSDTVWLLAKGWACPASDITSSACWGLRAWAMASGPACFGKKGAATPASMILARTVTGKTFAATFSRLPESEPPKTMR
jgi:hypothetical protein